MSRTSVEPLKSLAIHLALAVYGRALDRCEKVVSDTREVEGPAVRGIVLNVVEEPRPTATISNPIGNLPVELLRDIALYTIHGPEDRRTILRFSHVCKFWRLVIHDIGRLFTCADWSEWPEWLLNDWCTRATGPLNIVLGPNAVRRLKFSSGDGNSSSRFMEVLEGTKPRWEHLLVDLRELPTRMTGPPLYESPDPIIDAIDEFLFETDLPTLQRLCVIGPGGDGDVLNIPAHRLPALRYLRMDNRIPRLSSPLPNLGDTAVRFPFRFDYSWSSWSTVLEGAPVLESMTLDCLHLHNLNLESGQTHITLASLQTLNMESVALITIKVFLKFVSIPNLKSFTLGSTGIWGEDLATICTTLNQSSPHLESLSIDAKSRCIDVWNARAVLHILGDTNVLPRLQDICIGFRSSVGDGIAEFEIALSRLCRTRRMRKVAVPYLSGGTRREVKGLVGRLDEISC